MKLKTSVGLILCLSMAWGMSVAVTDRERDIGLTRVAIFTTLGSYLASAAWSQQSLQQVLPENRLNYLSIAIGQERVSDGEKRLMAEQIAMGHDWQQPLFTHAYYRLEGQSEWQLTHWHSRQSNARQAQGITLGWEPQFYHRFFDHWYVMHGVGLNVMSSTLVENRQKSTLFQFSDTIGLGYRNQNMSLGYRFSHWSNLDIAVPNPGVDLHYLQWQWHW